MGFPVDRESTLALLNRTRGPDRRRLQTILSGSLMTRDRAFRRGKANSPTCPWCSQEAEDQEHIFYRCWAWEELRDPELVSAMTAGPVCAPCTSQCGIARESALSRNATRSLAELAAAEPCAAMRARLECGEGIDREGCTEDGRTVVYTDGACKAGRGRRLRYGGMGGWWGLGHIANFSLPLAGRSQTNQRAELSAFVYAARLDGARRLEIRTDSRYVVDGVERFPQWQDAGWQGSNKDLWDMVRDVLQAEAGRVTARWVKGHATHGDVARRVTTWADRVGNNCADDLACRGAEVHVQRSPLLLAAREAQQETRRFTMKLQAMMLNIVKAWEESVDQLPWLYDNLVPDPFTIPSPLPDPRRPSPGSFARRVRQRRR